MTDPGPIDIEGLRERAEAARARAAALPPRKGRDSGHCGRKGCPCTHDGPCDHGWIEWPDHRADTGLDYENVAPCPTCRPDAWAKLEATMRGSSRDA